MTRRAFGLRGAAQTRHAAQLPPAPFARLLTALLAVAAVALPWQVGEARSATSAMPPSSGQTSSRPGDTRLPSVTIESTRERELARRVHQFVTSVISQPVGESLMRWNTPICPIVEGLPPQFDDFIRDRISQIAQSARAPVAGKQCIENLYVFVTYDPNGLLKKLLAKNRGMYQVTDGLGRVHRFMQSRRPVRVWYNTRLDCDANSPTAGIVFKGSKEGAPGGPMDTTSSDFCTDVTGSRLGYQAVNAIGSVYIVVDMNAMRGVTTRQLADYVGLIGLADVHLDANAAAVSTILRLFQPQGQSQVPQGLSVADRTLLYSLYNTRQADVEQASEMETAVVKQVTRESQQTASISSDSASPPWTYEGLPLRDAKAIYWYHINAEQGSAAAQYNLGVKYDLGQGVPQDYAQAAQWFRKAAEQGDADAQASLASAYANGQGVQQDDSQAAQWYLKAAEQGRVDAQTNLAFMYYNGDGVPTDYAQALHWYRAAAGKGNSDAQYNLGVMYLLGQGVPRDYTQAAQWFRKAAEQGDANAQRCLGLAYAKGQGLARNYVLTAQWFRKAAEQGDAHAQFYLGNMYNSGLGLPRDHVRAYKWWAVAKADSGFGDDAYGRSIDKMTRSASKMTPGQVTRANREASEWLAAHRAARAE